MFGPPVWHRSSPMKAIRAKAPGAQVEYLDGTDPAAAAALAKRSDVAIVFVNQPSTEGSDIVSLSLPDNQDALAGTSGFGEPAYGGGYSEWRGRHHAMARPGEQCSGRLVPRYSRARPWPVCCSAMLRSSGKLPLTFPRSEADVPRPKLAEQPPPRGAEDTAAFFPGAAFKVNSRHFDLEYTEGLKVGYKWYEAENKQPLFPFGYGLSYTTYAYSGLAVTPGERPSVSFTVKNTGARAGEETAQVYVSLPANAGEPFRRLVAWEKVALHPGESKKITLPLDQFLSDLRRRS